MRDSRLILRRALKFDPELRPIRDGLSVRALGAWAKWIVEFVLSKLSEFCWSDPISFTLYKSMGVGSGCALKFGCISSDSF